LKINNFNSKVFLILLT